MPEGDGGDGRGEPVRCTVLDAAQALCLEQGAASASLEAIAGRAGVSLTVLRQLYETRTDLLADLGGRLYLEGFPFEVDPDRKDLRLFLEAYLDIQRRPEVRLIWELGGEIGSVRPGGPDAAYWHLVGELELRLEAAGLDQAAAHERALVLTPAMMLVADRAARDLTTPEETAAFVAAACRLALPAFRGSPADR